MAAIDPDLLVLALARALPLAWFMPLGGRDIPRAVSLSVWLALASALWAFSPPLTRPLAGDAYLVAIACELALGAVFAFACALPFIALQWSGQLAQTLIVLRGSAETGPIATLFRLAALQVFFMLGGHRALSSTLLATLDDVPLGLSTLRVQPLWLGLAQIAVDALALALTLALPLLVTIWIVDLGLGLITRAWGHGSVALQSSSLRMALAVAVVALTVTPVIDALPLAVRTALAGARSLLRAVAS